MSDARTLLVVLAAATALAACESGAASPPPTPKSVEPAVTAPAPSAPSTTIAHGTETLAWTAGGHTFTVHVTTRGDASVLAFTDGAMRHTLPLAAGENVTLRVHDGTLAVRTSEMVGRAPEVGALFAYQAMIIGWDTATRRPIATKTWSCDDSTSREVCTPPAWAELE